GLYGPDTEAATIEFQKDKNIKVDGIVGPNTWEAAFSDSGVEQASPDYPGYLLEYEPGEPLEYDSYVEDWQERMNELGWSNKEDGLYGPNSEETAREFQEEANREFQEKANISEDGKVGPETWKASFNDEDPVFNPDLPGRFQKL
ncbi:MAG: hypothetical protein BRC54_15440, partial [Cyanobacteria bacterium SW_7_48_12]